MGWRFVVACLVLGIIATGCSSPAPAPPAPTVDVQAAIAAAVSATVSARPVLPTATPLPPTPLPPTATPPPTQTPQPSIPSATDIVNRLKAAGLPIQGVVEYTAENDLNHLLGRPNQYVAKAAWLDTRINQGSTPGTADGGTVEIFAIETDLKLRQNYVKTVTSGVAVLVEYSYAKGLVLLRVGHRLTPAQAAEYEKVVNDL